MKIVFLDRKTISEDISFDKFSDFGEFVSYDTTFGKDNTIDRVKDCEVILTNKVVIDQEVMENAKNLKLICICATGMNNVDLHYAQKNGIEVKNVSGYSTNSVVQHTFSMLFYLLEKLNYHDNFVKSGQWNESGLFTNIQKPFFEINGKRWGVIGLGTIGKNVANIAKSFGCEVVYYSTSRKNSDSDFEQIKNLDDLLSSCDIISIHSPLNKDTLNLINKDNLKLIKKDSILLNLGRGGIINESDLAKALDEQEFYAGLDVLEKEPNLEDNPLLDINNIDRLFITPHIAWASIQAQEKLIQSVYENIKNSDVVKI
jgi:glycerate dehydrogenase